jgi:hypothetical protein
MINLRGN